MNRMPPAEAALLGKLCALRTELVDLAYVLDSRGRFDAADVAMTTSARVGELCAELASGEPADPARAEIANFDPPLPRAGPGG
jgi:hypothetical protein